MATTVGDFRDDDLTAVLDLSLDAWAPVFASVERQLAGSGVYEAQHPDWRRDRANRSVSSLYESTGFTAFPSVRYFRTV